MGISCAGYIFDDSIHYIDHLGPFCALQNWPLVVFESSVAELCRRYYPGLEVIEESSRNFSFPNTIVSCEPARLIQGRFPFIQYPQIFWLPHGNSDKGWKAPYFESLQNETAIIYGQKMEDTLFQKKIAIPRWRIGNFRLHYWMQHRSFYDELISGEMKGLLGKKIYLYAPTWDDAEKNSSFWQFFPCLAAVLPKDSHLIVKLHPNMEKQKLLQIERLKGIYSKDSSILFLSSFPPIYPLLNLCNAYIGDMSSIGYDFLYWKRPMYFLNATKPLPEKDISFFLHRCGKVISSLEDVRSIFESAETPELMAIRSQIYEYTFDRSAQYRL